MNAAVSPRLVFADRLGAGAIGLATLAALAGLVVPDLYRDRPVLVEATRADNLFQLALAPLAALAYRRRGTAIGRVVLIGLLLYLAYFFGLYALAAVVSATTLVHIAVLGLAVWSLVLGMPAVRADAVALELGPRLLRRTTIAFLVLVAGFHIPLWASQILASAASGELPAALVSFGWLNTPVYAFDLALAMPLGIAAAFLLARHDARGVPVGVAFAWFSGLLALDMFVEQLWFAATGGTLDMSQAFPFGLIVLLSALVVVPTLVRRSPSPRVVPAAA